MKDDDAEKRPEGSVCAILSAGQRVRMLPVLVDGVGPPPPLTAMGGAIIADDTHVIELSEPAQISRKRKSNLRALKSFSLLQSQP